MPPAFLTGTEFWNSEIANNKNVILKQKNINKFRLASGLKLFYRIRLFSKSKNLLNQQIVHKIRNPKK